MRPVSITMALAPRRPGNMDLRRRIKAQGSSGNSDLMTASRHVLGGGELGAPELFIVPLIKCPSKALNSCMALLGRGSDKQRKTYISYPHSLLQSDMPASHMGVPAAFCIDRAGNGFPFCATPRRRSGQPPRRAKTGTTPQAENQSGW